MLYSASTFVTNIRGKLAELSIKGFAQQHCESLGPMACKQLSCPFLTQNLRDPVVCDIMNFALQPTFQPNRYYSIHRHRSARDVNLV